MLKSWRILPLALVMSLLLVATAFAGGGTKGGAESDGDPDIPHRVYSGKHGVQDAESAGGTLARGSSNAVVQDSREWWRKALRLYWRVARTFAL